MASLSQRKRTGLGVTQTSGYVAPNAHVLGMDLRALGESSSISLSVGVLAKPRSRLERLSRGIGGILITRVLALTENGQANKAIRALIARSLGLRVRDVVMVGWCKSRTKRVMLYSDGSHSLSGRLENLGKDL